MAILSVEDCGGSLSCLAHRERLIALSDDNKADVINALLDNDNTYYINGNQVDRSETSINLETYLIEAGFQQDDQGNVIVPEFVSGSIFEPTKYDLTRELSKLVPDGQGIDLLSIANIEKAQQLENFTSRDPIILDSTKQLQDLIESLKGQVDTVNYDQIYETRVRCLNPAQKTMQDPPTSWSEVDLGDPVDIINSQSNLTDDQKNSMIAVVGLIAMMAMGA